MSKQPRIQQIEGGLYLHTNHGGFLYMEQRTGKTLTSLQDLPAAGRVLIVTRSTIMPVWKDELLEEGVPEEQITVVRGTRPARERALKQETPYMICNYQMLINYRVFEKAVWDYIIFDESSILGNGTAKLTRYVMRAMDRQRNLGKVKVACLSGTPAPESPIQYASQFLITRGEYFGCNNLPDYLWKFWRMNDSKKLVPKNPLHLVDIKEKIQRECFIRTMDQLNMGSVKLFRRRYVTLNKAQKKAISWAIAKKYELNKGGGEVGDLVYVGYMNMIAAGVDPNTGEMINIDKILEVLEYYQENPEPMLIASFFKRPLFEAYNHFKNVGIPCGLITGETSWEDRENIIDRFQAGAIDIVFGQSDAIKMGLDFSRASITMVISNSFSNDTRDQLSMRTTNMNKKEAVEFIDICTKDTLDDGIVDKLVKKERISDSYLVSEYRKLEKKYDKEN